MSILENIIRNQEDKNFEIFEQMNEKERKLTIKRISQIFGKKDNTQGVDNEKIDELFDGYIILKCVNKYGSKSFVKFNNAKQALNFIENHQEHSIHEVIKNKEII